MESCFLETESTCFSFPHAPSPGYPVLTLWLDREQKDTWTWQSPRFQVIQAFYDEESWCWGVQGQALAAQVWRGEVVQEGLLALAFWEGEAGIWRWKSPWLFCREHGHCWGSVAPRIGLK